MNIQTFAILLAIVGWVVAILQTRKAGDLAESCRMSEFRASEKVAALKASLDSLAPLNESAMAAVAEIQAERDTQAKLAQERFELIEGVIQEKQVIWRIYRDSTRQAGVAQNWLLREYSSALQALNHYRRKAGQPEVAAPAQLTALVAEFSAGAAAIPDEPPVAPAPPGTGPKTADSPPG